MDLAYGDTIEARFIGRLKSGAESVSAAISAALKYDYSDWAAANALSGEAALEGASPFDDGIANLQKYAFGLNGSKSASFAESKNFGAYCEGGAARFKFAVAAYALGSVKATPVWSADLKTWSAEHLQVEETEEGDFKIYSVSHEDSSITPIFFKVLLEKR